MEIFSRFLLAILNLWSSSSNPHSLTSAIGCNYSSHPVELQGPLGKPVWRVPTWIKTLDGGKCVEIPGGTLDLFTQADIFDCVEGASHEHWYFNDEDLCTGDFAHIMNGKSGKCLGIVNPTGDNTKIGQVECQPYLSNGQFWQLNKQTGTGPQISYTLMNLKNFKCLSVGATSMLNNSPMLLLPCNGGRAQQFTLQPKPPVFNQ